MNLAKEVYEDEKATQEAVDAAFGQLQKAIFDLRQIPSKEKLEELIKDVEQMDLTGYTEESAGKVESALEFAKKVAFDENATSADVREGIRYAESGSSGIGRKI